MEPFFWKYDLTTGFEFDCSRYHVDASDIATHWHNYYQIALCTGGEGVFKFTDKAYPYRAGDLFLVDNTELHGAFSLCGSTADFLFVMFYPQFVVRSTEHVFDYEYLLPFYYDSHAFCNKIDGLSALGKQLRPMLLDLEMQNIARRPGYEHIISAKLRVVLAELLGYYGIGGAARETIERQIHMRPAIAYIEKHCNEPITLEQVAAMAHLSPSRFRHLFRETMRVGFKEYVIGLRYQLAKQLLATTDKSVEQVAVQAGFSNLYSFYSMFHERENTTPAVYRSRLKEKHSRF